MKKILESLGIYTINDLVCVIGGFLICIFFVEALFFIWDDTQGILLIKIMGTTISLIGICAFVDKGTK